VSALRPDPLLTRPRKWRANSLENRQFVDQKTEPRTKAIERWIATHRNELSRQGVVVATYRSYRGRKLGPYFRLAFRRGDGRQRSIYLGASAELAQHVRGLLQECQAGLREQRERDRVRKLLRTELKKAKALWRDELSKLGLRLQGYEVRGWRGAPRAQTREPGKVIQSAGARRAVGVGECLKTNQSMEGGL